MDMAKKPGMRTFLIMWAGQVVSLIGTAMSGFALTVWAYQETGQATALALVAIANFVPTIVLSPVAGAIVDRSNRKVVMLVSDALAAAATLTILLLASVGTLEIWHLYVAGLLSGTSQAFQFPAYSAAVTMMLPKEEYGRAHGMMSFAQSGSGILAPILGALVLGVAGLETVLIIDLVTFSAAFLTLAIIPIPQPEETDEGKAGRGNLWQESLYGFQYIKDRPSLLGLQLVFFFMNLIVSFSIAVMPAMLLARTGSELVYGGVQSAMGIGGVVGGLVMSVWGGPKRRVHGVLLGMAGSSLLGFIPMGVGQIIPIWIAAGFINVGSIAIINGPNQAIWQTKVAPDVQGRVFAARRVIAQVTLPLSLALGGPLADFVFEPAMMPGGALAPIFGGIVGVGTGAGMGLMFVLAGIMGVVVGLGGYLFPAIRNAEDILPDHEPAQKPEPATDTPQVEGAPA